MNLQQNSHTRSQVLTGDKYDGKADVWSVAITCIEMAEKLPPLNDVHPMRVIMCIPKNDPPTLQDGGKWSKKFKHFLKSCLMKNPLNRISASESLMHKFLSSENCSTAEELMMNVHRRLALEKVQGAPERRRRRRAALQGPARRGGTGASTVNTTNIMTGKNDTRTDNNSAMLKEWDKIKAATTVSKTGISSRSVGIEFDEKEATAENSRKEKSNHNIGTIEEEDDGYVSSSSDADEKQLNNTGTYISTKSDTEGDGAKKKTKTILKDGANVTAGLLVKNEEEKNEEEEEKNIVLADSSAYVMEFIRIMEGDLS
jgi:serine/threonine protein kinase